MEVAPPKNHVVVLMLLVIASLTASPASFAGDWRHDHGKKAYKRDESRRYQENSVEATRQEGRSGLAWVKAQWARVQITPARLAIGLGLLGLLITFNRNKRFTHWAVITGLSWLLLAFGVAAIYFHWRTFSW